MDEFKFALKCLLFTGLIVFASQFKVKNETLENKALVFLENSTTAEYLRDAALGGAEILTESYVTTKNFIKSKIAQAGGNSAEPLNTESRF